MRIVIATGTDVGAVALGDPTLLTELRESRGPAFERLRSEALASGAMWRRETGSDGSFLFHIHVDEEPPAALTPYLHDPVIVERLHIPSGRLLVAGEEMFWALPVDKYPQMGREVRLPAGDYKMTAHRCDAAHVLDNRFEEQATRQHRRALALGSTLPAICVGGTLAAVMVAYGVYLRTVSVGMALVPPLGAVGLWLWSHRYRTGPTYKAAEALYRNIELELPSIVVVLEAASIRSADPREA